MSRFPRTLAESLNAIEAELRALELWQPVPPAAADLASTAPFCHDTLTLPQWLQWIFLPRMRALVEGGHPLPQECNIAPYAREVLKGEPNTTRLVVLIKHCDQLIAES